jgi:hypothetical protein
MRLRMGYSRLSELCRRERVGGRRRRGR